VGFFGSNDIGLVEKAARIAIKFGTIYDQRTKLFIGKPDAVEVSAKKLDEWKQLQAQKDRRANAI
jgi:hypothetical protein